MDREAVADRATPFTHFGFGVRLFYPFRQRPSWAWVDLGHERCRDLEAHATFRQIRKADFAPSLPDW